MRLRTFCIGLGLALGVAVTTAEASAWVEIGRKFVADELDTDFVQADDERRFDQIRVCVNHRAVAFERLAVKFGNGGEQDFNIRDRIPAGDCTRALNLREGNRRLRRIGLKYETIHERGKQATVIVYGR